MPKMFSTEMYVVRVRIEARLGGLAERRHALIEIKPDERFSSSVICVAPLTPERGGEALASIIDKLRIESLKGQIEASRLESNVLAQKFESASTSAEKAKVARKHARALKQTHALQLVLELLERKQREAGGEVAGC